jgi:hypothetical protein
MSLRIIYQEAQGISSNVFRRSALYVKYIAAVGTVAVLIVTRIASGSDYRVSFMEMKRR